MRFRDDRFGTTASAATIRRQPGPFRGWIVREGRSDAIIRVGILVSSEEDEMSIFPTRILLATDGSAEAELATGTAVDLARMSARSCTWYTFWTRPEPGPALSGGHRPGGG